MIQNAIKHHLTIYSILHRQNDRFYDGDVFMPNDLDQDGGLDNHGSHVGTLQPLRSESAYDYRDTPNGKTKSQLDSNSIRSPSSMGMTHTTKSGSQSSIKSVGSLKETVSVNPNPKSAQYNKNMKFAEKNLEANESKFDDSRNLLGSYKDKSKEYLSSTSPVSDVSTDVSKKSITPVPIARKTVKSSSKTHLVEGIPQTEV